MFQRLLASLALYLFVGVGLFVTGHTQAAIAEPLPTAALNDPTVLAAVDLEQDVQGVAADNSMSNAQSELPEQIPQVALELVQARTRLAPAAPVQRAHTPPAPDALRRPPRA